MSEQLPEHVRRYLIEDMQKNPPNYAPHVQAMRARNRADHDIDAINRSIGRDFEEMNAAQIRRDRLQTIVKRLIPIGWALAIGLTAALLIVIFGHALARAADAAALAPQIMRK